MDSTLILDMFYINLNFTKILMALEHVKKWATKYDVFVLDP